MIGKYNTDFNKTLDCSSVSEAVDFYANMFSELHDEYISGNFGLINIAEISVNSYEVRIREIRGALDTILSLAERNDIFPITRDLQPLLIGKPFREVTIHTQDPNMIHFGYHKNKAPQERILEYLFK